MTRLTIRIDFDGGAAIGPGKVRLLELVGQTGSIRKAAAGMKMSYRRAWLLLKALEETFGQPLVLTATGGREGGGAKLSPQAERVVYRYRRLVGSAEKAAGADLRALEREILRGTQKPQKLRSIRRSAT